MKTIEEQVESFNETLGYLAAVFMSQGDIKAKHIIMPTEELNNVSIIFERALKERDRIAREEGRNERIQTELANSHIKAAWNDGHIQGMKDYEEMCRKGDL